MNILFLSISTAISNLNNRGIYPDLLREFADEGHAIFIVCPAERIQKLKTNLKQSNNVSTLMVQTLNITKTNILEKGISMLLIDHLFSRAIQKHFGDVKFDLILYATPPITFNGLIKKLKNKHRATTYLLLKDIFPQNAVDVGIISKQNPLYHMFRAKEKSLYTYADYIGCMSPANVDYIIKNNPEIQSEKVEVCPNSIALVSETVFDRNEIRKLYKIPIDTCVCIYGGNLGKPQGIDFLLEVLSSNKNRLDVFFVIAGSGTETYRIRSFIDVEKPNNVILFDQMPRIEFDQLLGSCDIGLIFLDKRYTIPNYPSRLLNYLEFKKPVLMAIDRNTDIGTIADANNYGLWAESGDLAIFNNNLNKLIRNPELLIEMGENGYKFLVENYTVDKSYKTIMSHFS